MSTDMLQAAERSLNASEYPASTLNITEFLQKLASTDPKLVEEWFKQEAERVEREAERVEREAALVELAERQLEKMEGLEALVLKLVEKLQEETGGKAEQSCNIFLCLGQLGCP